MRSEIAANRWQFESLQTANRDSRHLRCLVFIDLFMGLFRRAVFRHGGGARKQPIKQPTETPTSTMTLMGRFLSLMGRFRTLMGRFPAFVLIGAVFPLENPLENSPFLRKRGISRGSWLICPLSLFCRSLFITRCLVLYQKRCVCVCQNSQSALLGGSLLRRAKSKRGRREGDGTENVVNCRDVCRKLS